MISRNHKPGRIFGIALGERIFVGPHVVVPVLTLGVVGFTDLPALGGVVEPLLEALQLLVFTDVEKELEDSRAVGRRGSRSKSLICS